MEATGGSGDLGSFKCKLSEGLRFGGALPCGRSVAMQISKGYGLRPRLSEKYEGFLPLGASCEHLLSENNLP